jgi:hypothetical protein
MSARREEAAQTNWASMTPVRACGFLAAPSMTRVALHRTPGSRTDGDGLSQAIS